MFPIIGEVVIRTNSALTELTIDAEKDTVYHYDLVGNVTIKHVADASYDEFGLIAGVCAVEGGHVEVQNGGEMTSIVVTSASVENGEVVIDTVGNGTVGIVFVKDAETKTKLDTEKIKA